MSEQEPKGFRVIDRRGTREETPAETPPAAPPKEEPRKGPAGAGAPGAASPGKPGEAVPGGARPREEGPRVGGPNFLDLVGTLQMSAMASLGMLQTADGRRSPVNLGAAKDSIDILELLREKTRGNLTEEEGGALSEVLYHLRMAYVALVNEMAGPPQGPGGGGKK